ncbi:acyl-CoA dehydrogenase family protein [Rhizobium sp. WYJ-E13]|uniref:acyl-CoA dehydrogenase family protein n=1 Tax=Rhizobium sp. WYJ-E13 TaxID=2849093 RepID=UPI001C1F1402|nr:acyl-CoA dehydrogenase family protein [Rhizobium sp. WYJ-E13]QWW72469.1 hypothetical protein KQ933_31600 [Rhizobium sp. WYJ-E13]
MNIQSKSIDLEFEMPSVDELRVKFGPHLAEMESLRRLPNALVQQLETIGVFRMLAPRQFGGLELAFPTALELIRRISIVDGSIGWIAAINSGACLVLPRLPRSALGEIYSNGADQIVAGSAQALGIARRVPGGWHVSGRWPFASGCTAANWIIAGFKDAEPGADEKPTTKQMLLRSDRYTIEDTWKVLGLRGTGSHHVSITDAFVADAFVMTLGPGELSVDAPLYRHPAHLIALGHGAVHLGIAQAAVADVVALQRERSSDAPGRRDLIDYELGKCHGRLKAAQAVFNLQVNSNWSDATNNIPAKPVTLGNTVQTLVQIAAETLDIVRTCFEIAGSAAIYDESPLQRRLRDIQVATQHGLVQRANWVAGGKALLEEDGSASLNNSFFSALATG